MAKPTPAKRSRPPAPRVWEDLDMYPEAIGEAPADMVQPPTVPFVALWALIAVGASVLTVLTTLVPDGPVRSGLALLIIGLLQPLLEWKLLQHYLRALPLLPWWAYSIVGLVLGALLLMLVGVVFIVVGLQFGNSQQTGQALAEASAGPLGVILTGAVGGLATAGARWLLLRRYFSASPVLFFAGTILGLILGGFVGPVGFVLFDRGTLPGELAGNVISALVSGAFAGAAVLSLFRGHVSPARA